MAPADKLAARSEPSAFHVCRRQNRMHSLRSSQSVLMNTLVGQCQDQDHDKEPFDAPLFVSVCASRVRRTRSLFAPTSLSVQVYASVVSTFIAFILLLAAWSLFLVLLRAQGARTTTGLDSKLKTKGYLLICHWPRARVLRGASICALRPDVAQRTRTRAIDHCSDRVVVRTRGTRSEGKHHGNVALSLSWPLALVEVDWFVTSASCLQTPAASPAQQSQT